MSGIDNLRPVRTKEEARERGRVGGIKSGEVRRELKTAKDVAELIGRSKIQKNEIRQTLKAMGVPETDLNYKAAVVAALYREALKGNIKAAETVLELMGELVKKTETKLEMPIPLVDYTNRKRNGASDGYDDGVQENREDN